MFLHQGDELLRTFLVGKMLGPRDESHFDVGKILLEESAGRQEGRVFGVQREHGLFDGDDPLGIAPITTATDPFTPFTEEFRLWRMHTIDTYHVPLVVSAGEDGSLGLFEPTDSASFGYLAQPDPANLDDLVDNVTNLNIRVGGN